MPEGDKALATDLATQTDKRLLCKLESKFINVLEKNSLLKRKDTLVPYSLPQARSIMWLLLSEHNV